MNKGNALSDTNRNTTIRHPGLEATGLFAQFWGPAGGVPVQLMGVLTTGEQVYFRARGKNITLEVSRSQDDPERNNGIIARYRKDAIVDDDNPFGASLIDVDEAAGLIDGWLQRFIAGDRPIEPARR